MTFDALSPDPENSPENDVNRTAAIAPAPEAPLVLSGRDRFAIRLIDAAVKIGSEDFQARYRPVTEELFSHHVIDPTAKPAYVQPALEPIVNLETTEDPLEIIRLHLDNVIEDRQARDEARINAEAHLADVSQQLAESQAHAADLQQQLITQTARADAAETEVARLHAELQSQVSALTAQRESEVGALHQQREAEVAELHQQRENQVGELSARLAAEVAALTAQREADVSAAHQQREAELAALANERDAHVAALHQQRENELVSLSTQRDADLAALQQQRDAEVAELQSRLASEAAALTSQRENEVATLRSERDATIAGLHAQRETEVASLTTELAELRAQRDAQVAELTARLESQVAELEGSRTTDVTALAAEHTSQVGAIDDVHQQQIAELKAAHDAQVEELTATHEQQLAELATSHERQTTELISEKEALAAQLQGDSGPADSALSDVRTDLAAAVARAEQAASELEESRAQIASLRRERDLSDAQRDAAIEELDGVTAQRGEWENRLRLTVAALAGADTVGDWTDDNAPDERLVQFVQSTTSALEQKLIRIEQIATEELVDETETNEYAIGANDAAVRVLNALDDVDADATVDAQ
jgi:hypothetical protein